MDGGQQNAYSIAFKSPSGQASSSFAPSSVVRVSATDSGYFYVGNAGNKTISVTADASNITVTISPANGDTWTCAIRVVWSAEA